MPKQPLRHPELDEKTVTRALRLQDGLIRNTSRQLGISIHTLHDRLHTLGLVEVARGFRLAVGLLK